MSFSFHPDTKNIHFHALYSHGYIQEEGNLRNIARRILDGHITSPNVYEGGVRRGKNWLFADYLVLDFDDPGMGLQEACNYFKDMCHFIAITKSHGKIKKGVKCDRFRVWLKLEQRCTDGAKYTFNTKHLAKKLNADSQAIDLARKFLPSPKIIQGNMNGCLYTLLPKPVQPKIKPLSLRHSLNKYIPMWAKTVLEGGVASGSRNYTCYSLGKWLGKNGFSIQEICSMIRSSPIAQEGFPSQEIEQAVRSGMNQRGSVG